jgi:hypothetical protein
MTRALLILAFVGATGAAAAQTAPTASMRDAAGANHAPDIASAPIPETAAVATARKRIEMDGYRDVQGLAIGPDGLWQGTAIRGNTSVQVTVDRSGNVAAK